LFIWSGGAFLSRPRDEAKEVLKIAAGFQKAKEKLADSADVLQWKGFRGRHTHVYTQYITKI